MALELTSNLATQATLADYTGPSLIVPVLRECDTAGIISELSQALQREGCVTDVLPFYHAALNQELLSSSALPCGIAFPHARLSGAKRLQYAFGRAAQPVNWGANGAAPVQLVFLLAVPATDAASYLHLLASLARLGEHQDYLRELRAAQDAEAILAVFEKISFRKGQT